MSKGTIVLDREYLKSDPPEIVQEALKTGEFSRPTIPVRTWPIGSPASSRVKCRWPTWKSDTARLPSATWGTSRGGPVANCNGIPTSEQFIGDAEANQFLRRTQRSGFEIPDEV